MSYINLKPELKITLAYLAIGGLWILLSDEIILSFSTPIQHALQTIKGLLFVSFTGLVLYLLLRRYYAQLNNRINRLQKKELALQESERQYRELFESGPLPKYIFDANTLQFLYANQWAIEHYGYTREQFMAMKLSDIRPVEDMSLVEETLARVRAQNGNSYHGNFRHLTASGKLCLTDVYCHGILYHGREAVIVVANDVTERINYITAIEKQNKKLQDISFMQSHVVRAPLASLMGCVAMLRECGCNDTDNGPMLDGIYESASKLDNIIRDISAQTAPVAAGDI